MFLLVWMNFSYLSIFLVLNHFIDCCSDSIAWLTFQLLLQKQNNIIISTTMLSSKSIFFSQIESLDSAFTQMKFHLSRTSTILQDVNTTILQVKNHQQAYQF